MHAIKEEVLRIANGSYYVGPGEYELFVVRGEKLEKLQVQLGESNYDFVEVISGLQPGDQVVVSDMKQYQEKQQLKLK